MRSVHGFEGFIAGYRHDCLGPCIFECKLQVHRDQWLIFKYQNALHDFSGSEILARNPSSSHVRSSVPRE